MSPMPTACTSRCPAYLGHGFCSALLHYNAGSHGGYVGTSAVLLQAWCVASLEERGSQMPVVVPRGLMFLLEVGNGAEGGRYFVSIWYLFFTQGPLQCRVAASDVIW